MKMKPRIFNYVETTYGIKEFGATDKKSRADVTYYARVRSRNALLQRLLKLPIMQNATANWIRKRIAGGSGGMEQIITDDSIYVETRDSQLVIGKFTVDNEWVAFDPPLKAHRPWLNHLGSKTKEEDDTTKSKTLLSHTFKTVDAQLEAFAVNPSKETFKALCLEITKMKFELQEKIDNKILVTKEERENFLWKHGDLYVKIKVLFG